MKNSILLIHPYFGKFPNLFDFWLYSCVQNPTVNFLIVTDQNLVSPSPNIIVVRSDLNSIKEKAEKVLKFPVVLDKPYKLCDYRPIYHLIFAEYVQKFDFWGYCDSDMILGDIRSFLTDDILDRYDYILGMGHMHLQRTNDSKYENVWKTSNCRWHLGGYKYVFSHPENLWFDELPHGVSARYYEMYPEKIWTGFFSEGRCFESCDCHMKYKFIDTYNTLSVYPNSMYFADVDRFPFWKREKGEDMYRLVYIRKNNKLYKVGIDESGRIFQKEILYAHFYKRHLRICTKNTDSYIIRPNAVIDYVNVSKRLLIWYSIHPDLFVDKIKTILKNRLNRYFHLKIK